MIYEVLYDSWHQTLRSHKNKVETCHSKTQLDLTGTTLIMQQHQHQRRAYFRSHRQRYRTRQAHHRTSRIIQVRTIEDWRARNGALHHMPKDFDPSRYASFSVKEVVEEPVNQEHIHQYVERSRLSKRLGFWFRSSSLFTTSYKGDCHHTMTHIDNFGVFGRVLLLMCSADR